MREYIVPRKTYQTAAVSLLEQVGFDVTPLQIGKLLAKSHSRLLYIDVAGKQLPYFRSKGQKVFPWETHVKNHRLETIEHKAKEFGAEPWLCICYFIRDLEYEKDFENLTKLAAEVFGIKLICVEDYKSSMRPRSSNSWDVVELPRNDVLKLTIEASDF